MDLEQFRREATKLVEFICEFRRNAPNQRVCPGPDIKANQLLGLLGGEFHFMFLRQIR